MRENLLDTDVAIIGGGGAGVAAALEAGESGATMVLLEQDDTLGGTAATSGGGCLIVGTPLQESLGIHDTPDLAFSDWVTWGQGEADEVWARYYIEHTPLGPVIFSGRVAGSWAADEAGFGPGFIGKANRQADTARGGHD